MCIYIYTHNILCMCICIYIYIYIHILEACRTHELACSQTQQQQHYTVAEHSRTHRSDRCRTRKHSDHSRTRVHPHGMGPQWQIPEHKCRTQPNKRSHPRSPKQGEAGQECRTQPNTAPNRSKQSAEHRVQRPEHSDECSSSIGNRLWRVRWCSAC